MVQVLRLQAPSLVQVISLLSILVQRTQVLRYHRIKARSNGGMFRTNAQTLDVNTTIEAENANVTGPLTIASGIHSL